MNMVSRGARNAFRNITRTASIVVTLGISIGLALAMLVAREAVTTKIETVKSSVGNTVTVQPAGARGFEGGGEPLTSAQATKLAALDHVSSTTQTVSDRLTTDTSDLESGIDAGSLGERNAARSGVGFQQPPSGAMPGGMGGESSSSGEVTRTFTPPVTVTGTNDPESTLAATGSDVEITSGEIFASDSDEQVAVIGKALAEKNELSVGDTFTAYDTNVEVVAIYDAGNDFANNQAVMPLATIQTLSDQEDQLTSIVLNVDSIDNITNVSEAASDVMGDNGDVTDSQSTVEAAVEPLENIQTISMYSLIGAVLAGAVIILLTMVMIVRERRREIGVLKAIGGSNLVVMGQFIVESVTLTLMGTIVGLAIGVAAASPITDTLVSTSTSQSQQMGPGGMGGGGPRGFGGAGQALGQSVQNIQTNVGIEVLAYGITIALVIAVLGSALASIFISKVRPAEVMRAE